LQSSYAVFDTGELWGYHSDRISIPPIGHGEQMHGILPKPIESLRGVKVDAVAAGVGHTLALASDGSVYSWGNMCAAKWGVLGLGPTVGAAEKEVHTPERIATLCAANGF
jgi:alpha-tubulin suppressor-like RCC1 family protein